MMVVAGADALARRVIAAAGPGFSSTPVDFGK
jgi:hypothetical protein